MKKLVAVLALMMMIPAMLMASSFDITLGASATSTYSLQDAVDAFKNDDTSELKDLKSYVIGPEIKMHMSILEFDLKFGILQSKASGAELFKDSIYPVNADLGLSFTLFGFLRIGATAGIDAIISPKSTEDPFQPGMFNAMIGNFTSEWAFLFSYLVSEGKSEIGAAFLAAPFRLKASVDFLIGPVTLGGFYSVVTPFCMAAITDADAWGASGMNDVKIAFNEGLLGLFLGIRL